MESNLKHFKLNIINSKIKITGKAESKHTLLTIISIYNDGTFDLYIYNKKESNLKKLKRIHIDEVSNKYRDIVNALLITMKMNY